MAIELTDDGTMDTVLRCSDCGEEMRYNYDPEGTDERAAELEAEYRRQYGLSYLPEPEIDAKVAARVDETLRDEFIKWAIEDATADHECPNDPDAEPSEPEDGDITTEDHKHFYMHGKLCLEAIEDSTGEWWQAHKGHMSIGATWIQLGRFASVEQAIKAYMVLEQYWPNCWFISDHGNAHLIDLNEGK
jgi:hypothetical protein